MRNRPPTGTRVRFKVHAGLLDTLHGLEGEVVDHDNGNTLGPRAQHAAVQLDEPPVDRPGLELWVGPVSFLDRVKS